jgi:DNA-binding response OmpR family regulator
MSMQDFNSDRVRILVADDEAYILQVVALKLRNAGFEVLTAYDGEEALSTVRSYGADLVVTDLQMPGLTGIALARAMAADPKLAGIPIMMLTARGHLLHEGEADSANIARVVQKPFSPRALLEEIEALLAERRRAA